MKVVSRGVKPEDIDYSATCRNCISTIEFKKHEARIVSDRNEIVYVLKCPVCSKDIWISSQAMRPVAKSENTDFRDQPYEPK